MVIEEEPVHRQAAQFRKFTQPIIGHFAEAILIMRDKLVRAVQYLTRKFEGIA